MKHKDNDNKNNGKAAWW